jgi:hypothetical protein
MAILKLTFALQQRIAHRGCDGCTIGSLLPEASCEEMSSDPAATPQKYRGRKNNANRCENLMEAACNEEV